MPQSIRATAVMPNSPGIHIIAAALMLSYSSSQPISMMLPVLKSTTTFSNVEVTFSTSSFSVLLRRSTSAVRSLLSALVRLIIIRAVSENSAALAITLSVSFLVAISSSEFLASTSWSRLLITVLSVLGISFEPQFFS